MSRSTARVFVLLVAAATLPAVASAQVTSRNVDLKSQWNEFSVSGDYSNCWSYIHQNGDEYAVIGCYTGTAIYNVTDPVNSYRVGFIPGASSDWREMKSYRNWIYVVTEAGGSSGLQIIRMTNPELPVLAATIGTQFNRSHTVSVDTSRALLFCNGTRTAVGTANGMHIYSLANPEAPTWLARWPAGTGMVSNTNYIHDCVPIGNLLYASSIYSGIQRVFDTTNPATPVQLKSWTYTGAFTHNSWPDATGRWLYVTDEVNGEPLKIFDLINLANPVLVNSITSNPQAIVHNAHVLGNELYLSNYTEGIRILDISDPAHPAEFAWADSWQGVSGNFHGAWGVCPYFPSGTVIASDIETGLYVYRPVRDYGILRVNVELAGTIPDACALEAGGCCCAPNPCDCGDETHALMGPGAGVTVTLSSGDSLKTTADGIVQFAPNPGTYTITARKFGYANATASRTVTMGSRDTLTLVMGAQPVGDFAGVVKSSVTEAPVEEAEVNLAYTMLHDHTDGLGQFLMSNVPRDSYQVEVRRPGSIASVSIHELGPGNTSIDFELEPAVSWDALESESGWTAGDPGDDATAGQWVRVDPIGTGQPQNRPRARTPGGVEVVDGLEDFGFSLLAGVVGGDRGPGLMHEGHESDGAVPGTVQPELDRSPPPGTMCFITGQGVDPDSISQADVDGGHTTLTSPVLDLTGLANPMIAYWHWFYASDAGLEDGLIAQLTNNDGITWVPVDTTRGLHNHWMERIVKIADYVVPSDQVRIRFVAMDIGDASVVEAGIDDLSIYGGPVVISAPAPGLPTRLAFRAPWPNPARGDVNFRLDVPAAGPARVEVLDLQGRLVRTVFEGPAGAGMLDLAWDGRGADGTSVAAGVYYARARVTGIEATTRFVFVR